MKQFKSNGFTFKHDMRDGWTVESPSNRQYDLLEGKSYEGKASSDIVFIFDPMLEEESPGKVVSFVYGAEFGIEDCQDFIESAIAKYEKELC